MSVDALAGLLARRLTEVGRTDEEVVSVAELHRTLLPYHICRNTLGYATKAEYDVELLELLATEQFLFPAESELRSAVSTERTSPEPGLGFLKNFAAAQLRIQPKLAGSPPEPASAPLEPIEMPEPAEPQQAVSEAVVVSEVMPASETQAATDTEATRQSAAAAEPTMGACWKCQEGLPDRPGLRFCVFCGSDQQRPRCLACDEELDGGWRFCPRCGTDRSTATSSA